MTGALMLCEAEFHHLTCETAKLTHVRQVEFFQPCPNTTVGKLYAKTPVHPIKVTYTNGSVDVDAHAGRVALHTSVEQAVRFIRAVLHLDALHELLQRLHAK